MKQHECCNHGSALVSNCKNTHAHARHEWVRCFEVGKTRRHHAAHSCTRQNLRLPQPKAERGQSARTMEELAREQPPRDAGGPRHDAHTAPPPSPRSSDPVASRQHRESASSSGCYGARARSEERETARKVGQVLSPSRCRPGAPRRRQSPGPTGTGAPCARS